jgi:bacterial/archaeal transporter family-2 protein
MNNLYMIAAVIMGAATVVQVLVNTELRSATMSVVWAAFIQFVVGLTALAAAAVVLKEPLPLSNLSRAPWWIYAGGLIGASYILLSILLLPRLGAALLFVSIVAGQLAGSLVIDHYGWLGAAVHRLSPARIAGAALVAIGVTLIRWR